MSQTNNNHKAALPAVVANTIRAPAQRSNLQETLPQLGPIPLKNLLGRGVLRDTNEVLPPQPPAPSQGGLREQLRQVIGEALEALEALEELSPERLA